MPKTASLRLSNTEDGSNIDTNKGRTVSGTITVPPSVYQGAETGSLSLRVEIFSSADTGMTYGADGLITADHGEYNTGNNTWLTAVEHKTYFDTADKITLAMGKHHAPARVHRHQHRRRPGHPGDRGARHPGRRQEPGRALLPADCQFRTGNTQGVLVVTPSRRAPASWKSRTRPPTPSTPSPMRSPRRARASMSSRTTPVHLLQCKRTEYDESATAGSQDWSFTATS